jgi:hypothetical protein
MEKFAILCFAPYAAEAVLKALSGFEAESYGVLQPDGTVKPRGERVRGLTHLVMKMGDFTEPQVALILVGIEAVACVAAFILAPII